ncbi:MAG: helix-turn-helix domain-containing protein [Bradymonadaceae bacterium]
MNIQTIVQNNVKRIRHEQERTQQEVADEAGIARAYLGRLETQGRNISIEVLERLADTLGVKPADLISEPKEEDA